MRLRRLGGVALTLGAAALLILPQPAVAGTQLWDFEAGNDDGWDAPNGSWEVNDGVYQEVTGGEAAMHSVIGEDGWDDYVVSAKVRLDEGAQWAGIAFRVQSDFEYYIYYMNVPDNKSELWVHSEPAFDTRANLAQIPGNNILIENEVFHELEVVVEGDTFQLWIDGELQSEDTDPTYSKGKIGVWAWATQASFDDVMVTGDDIKDTLPVEAEGKLATAWGRMKAVR